MDVKKETTYAYEKGKGKFGQTVGLDDDDSLELDLLSRMSDHFGFRVRELK